MCVCAGAHAKWVSMYVCASCIYLSIPHLSLFDRNTAASTLTPQRTLSRQSVCQRRREMECVYVPAMNKSRKEVVSWETWKRSGEMGGGDSFKGRLRGHISEKVEWDIWKRERESLGQGGNCSCPTMIHWGKFSSTSPSPPSHLSLRTTPHSGWSITMRKMRSKHLQFYISCVSSKTLRRFCTDWYFDTDARPFSLSRDLSMNNISEIQSRAFHRLHLLSELWVKSFSSHSIDKPPSAQLTHDKKQLFPEPPISSVMGIDDSGLLLISPAKKQPAAMASRSWDGCTKEGEGGWTW